MPHLSNNQIVNNKYKVIKFIASGGFGEVYLVSDISQRTNFALKIMPIEPGFDVLEREAEAGRQLNHPNVVKIYDFQVMDGFSYIVMEYLPEGNLQELIQKRNSNIGQAEFVSYATQILNGLKEINTLMIHRDLKPQNILFDGKILKISDFGLAKYVEDATRSNSFKGAGTFAYMAPETWEQKRATESTDIYSLGVIFYEMLTFRLPYQASNPIEWRREHLFAAIPHIRSHNANLSIKLDEIVCKMMAKDMNSRYKDAEEVIKKISELDDLQGENDPLIVAIVGNATAKLSKTEEALLKKRKAQESLDEEIKKVDLKIKEMLSGFDEIIEKVNLDLERTKIMINKNNNHGLSLYNNYREYSFLGKTVEIRFFGNYLEDKELNLNGVFSAGYMRIRMGNDLQHGFNLLLIRKSDDLYGEWYVGAVRDSALVRRAHKYEPYAFDNYGEFKEHFCAHFRKAMHVTVISLKDNVNEEFASLVGEMVK